MGGWRLDANQDRDRPDWPIWADLNAALSAGGGHPYRELLGGGAGSVKRDLAAGSVPESGREMR